MFCSYFFLARVLSIPKNIDNIKKNFFFKKKNQISLKIYTHTQKSIEN